MSPARHVQCNHSSDDGNYADDLEDADRLSKVENPDSRYQRGIQSVISYADVSATSIPYPFRFSFVFVRIKIKR